MIKEIPVVNILEIDVVNYKPGGILILFNSNSLLPLPKQLHFGHLIDVNIDVSILLCLQLCVEELVLPSGNTVHHLLVGHQLVNTLKD